MPSETTYKYGKRETADMSRRSFALGQGRISGYLSLTLGLLSFLAVLAWRFPAQLTTRELREVYDPEQLRLVLMTCMWASLLFGGCAVRTVEVRARNAAVPSLASQLGQTRDRHQLRSASTDDRPLVWHLSCAGSLLAFEVWNNQAVTSKLPRSSHASVPRRGIETA